MFAIFLLLFEPSKSLSVVKIQWMKKYFRLFLGIAFRREQEKNQLSLVSFYSWLHQKACRNEKQCDVTLTKMRKHFGYGWWCWCWTGLVESVQGRKALWLKCASSKRGENERGWRESWRTGSPVTSLSGVFEADKIRLSVMTTQELVVVVLTERRIYLIRINLFVWLIFLAAFSFANNCIFSVVCFIKKLHQEICCRFSFKNEIAGPR